MEKGVFDMIQAGLNFYSRPNNTITVLKKFNDKFYLVEDKNIITGDTRNDILLTPEDIQNDLNSQEEIKKGIEKQLEFNKQQEQNRQEEEEQKEEEQQEYNSVYGYCDYMSHLQKGKILKVLNKSIRHNNKNITRKEFIKSLLESGYTLAILDKMLTSSRKTRQLERIETYKNNVPIIKKENVFYEITKTEYNFAMYLIENVLISV
jgi:hypothetical protein